MRYWTRWKFLNLLLFYASVLLVGVIRKKASYPVQSSRLVKWADLVSSLGSLAAKYILVTSHSQKLGGTIINLHNSHVIALFSQMLNQTTVQIPMENGHQLRVILCFLQCSASLTKIQFSKCLFTDCSVAIDVCCYSLLDIYFFNLSWMFIFSKAKN